MILVKGQSDSCEELLSQLDSELNKSWEQLKELKDALKHGAIGLEQFNEAKSELETRIEDLSERIKYIHKAQQKIPTTEERILQEAQLLMNEYQVDIVNDRIYHLQIYLTVSVEQTWIIEINFKDPKVPLLKIPSDLPLMIGNPYETIKSLQKWQGSRNEHLINIVREIESKLLNLEFAKSMPELELERGRIMSQAKEMEAENEYSRAMVFYNYAADISERLGNQAIAVMCRLKAKKMLERIQKKRFTPA